jgi:hypothetical protein
MVPGFHCTSEALAQALQIQELFTPHYSQAFIMHENFIFIILSVCQFFDQKRSNSNQQKWLSLRHQHDWPAGTQMPIVQPYD